MDWSGGERRGHLRAAFAASVSTSSTTGTWGVSSHCGFKGFVLAGRRHWNLSPAAVPMGTILAIDVGSFGTIVPSGIVHAPFASCTPHIAESIPFCTNVTHNSGVCVGYKACTPLGLAPAAVLPSLGPREAKN